MIKSIQTSSSWERDDIRLLVGFLLIGFGLVFWTVISQEVPEASMVRLLAQSLAALPVIGGLYILLLNRLVLLDPKQRQVVQVVMVVRIVVRRREWAFSDFCNVVVQRGYGEEGNYCWVGLSGAKTTIWIRTFLDNHSTDILSEAAMHFAKELAATLGLPVEIRAN